MFFAYAPYAQTPPAFENVALVFIKSDLVVVELNWGGDLVFGSVLPGGGTYFNC
jgi:hypothetical protein